MPHPKGRKQETRNQILRAAARLFAMHGFHATTIEAVMRECGLTRGGFYAHFRSKSHLYEEASDSLGHFGKSPDIHEAWIESLLSACAIGVDATEWASLSSDVANQSREVREGYTRAVKALRDKLSAANGATDREQTLSQVAMLIGALAICATSDDRVLRESLIDACRSAVQTKPVEDQPALFWMVDRTLVRNLAEKAASH